MSARAATQKEPTAEPSEIILQCVIYAQALGAYYAGYKVDASGDSRYAGRGNEIKSAQRAMVKLNTFSRTEGAPPLTAQELYAKAGVLAAMYGLQKDEEPNEDERTYVRFFADEVMACLAANCGTVLP